VVVKSTFQLFTDYIVVWPFCLYVLWVCMCTCTCEFVNVSVGFACAFCVMYVCDVCVRLCDVSFAR
jgi:hypothetical protein